jgi:hypothetical protein
MVRSVGSKEVKAQWSMVTRGRRRRCDELARLTSMANGLSSNLVLEEEAMTVSPSPGLDGDGSGSTVAGHGE